MMEKVPFKTNDSFNSTMMASPERELCWEFLTNFDLLTAKLFNAGFHDQQLQVNQD